MASGNSNQKSADKAQKNAVNALKPQSYSDPFGSLAKGKFTPNISSSTQAGLNNFDSTIGQMSGQLNKPFDINDYYNNPFYATASEQYKAPVMRQYQQDQTDLANNLNARNQMGSSYDALMNRNLMQQRDFQLNQADDQARTASASAYQQQYQNLLNSISAATSGKSSLLDQIYAPAKLALGYQGALNPLQQAQAGVYNTAQQQYLSRPTATDRIMQMYGMAQQAAATAAAAAL